MPFHHFRKLSHEVFTYGLLGTASRTVGLLLLPIFTRLFSVDEYGTIDIIATFTTLVTVTLVLGQNSALARYYHDTSLRTEKLYTTVLVSVGAACSIGLALTWVSADWIGRLIGAGGGASGFIMIAAGTASMVALSQVADQFLRMQKRIVAFGVLSIIEPLLYGVLALTAVIGFRLGLLGVFSAQLAAAGARLGAGLVITRRHIRFPISLSYLGRILRFSLPLWPTGWVTWANRQISRILLLLLLGLGGVGVFGVGARIARLVEALVGMFRRAWIPFSMELIDHSDRDVVYGRTLKYYVAAFLLIGAVVTAAAPEVLAVLVPPAYRGAYVVIPWVIGGAVINGSAAITNLGPLLAERTGVVSLSAWIGFLANLGLSAFLIGQFGILGAGLGFFLGECIFSAMLFVATQRAGTIRFEVRPILGVLATYVLASGLLIFVESFPESSTMKGVMLRLTIALFTCWVIVRLTWDDVMREVLLRGGARVAKLFR